MDSLDRAAAIIAEIDPLAGYPVYLIDGRTACGWDPRFQGGSCLAWTSHCLDTVIAPWLRADGVWRGRGFATIIHTEAIKHWPAILGITLHEFAHFLDAPRPASCPAIERVDWTPEQSTTILPASLANERYDPVGAVPWAGHGAGWVRACCHLFARASEIEPDLRHYDLGFGRYYPRRFCEVTWLHGLAAEINPAERRSIRGILASEPPRAFAERFEEATATVDGSEALLP